MRNLIIFKTAICIAILTLTSALSAREKYNFNYDWKIMVADPANAEKADFDDSDWQKISLPRAWNEDEAFKLDIHDLSTGICWYRKQFKMPENTAGKKVFIEFEGVRQGGEVYCNGIFVGRHENGAMAFGLDISSLVKFGQENTIAVRTDNDWSYREKNSNCRFQWNDKNFNANYGGIPKNVVLHICDDLYQTLPLYSNLGTTGVYIYATEFDIPGHKALITAESQVKNEQNKAVDFGYQVTIEDMSGKTIKTFEGLTTTISPGQTLTISAKDKVEGLNFWSWGYGYLYNVTTSLIVNGKTTDSITTKTGFRKTEFGNGMIKLNDRTLMIKGYAQRTSNEWPAVGMSVPPWLSDFSNHLAVESNGNTVRWMHITPWKQDIESCDRVGLIQAMPAGDSEKDVDDYRWTQRCELMRDAIIYNRNNPSIIFYEGGNENISDPHMTELKAIRDKYDPFGGRAAGSREMLDSKVAEYGGEMLYINKSAKHPMWAMEYSRDEGLRRYIDEYTWPFHKNSPDYNRNQDSHAIENIIRWYDYWECRPGTGKRVSSGGVNIVFSDTNTHFRGDENYRRSGEVDAMRIPKDGFFVHQVMWDGWVDIEKPAAYIFGHWNYQKDTVKDIYVCSSAEKVELFINGKSSGFGDRSYDFLFTFPNISYEPGIITAVGYDTNDNEICRYERETAGEPVAIKLTPRTSPDGLHADGADLMLCDVEVIDSKGRRCPTAFNMIDFSLNGPAEWRGGIAQGENNYILSKSLPVELGINRILIRSTSKSGHVTLTANSEGLNSDTIELDTIPVKVEDGLSAYFQSNTLPCRLDRGPTPMSKSYTIKRLPVEIASATAGGNAEDLPLSYDDDEMTKWSNNNLKDAGWITYQLAREAKINQICLKLNKWRTRSYPLKVLVNDKEVFTGETPQSLGYVTLNFEPTTGDKVTIELIGISKDEDGFNLVEVTGKKDEQGKVDKNAKGELAILEIEFYEPVN